MSKPVISVENLSKLYRLGLKEEMPDTLVGAMTSLIRSPVQNFQRLRRLDTFAASQDDNHEDSLWALKDVSFDVQEGDVVGIIGRNGAGKSTLLKILSRITEPTSGRVVLRGRVSSLLEVGTGFHPELTGRENIYMNGTILGMTKREVDRKFDEIVDFSGVERFLDTPVKRYSSGMQVRLAFAVAAHLEPEILIIDEVLAVGDAEFQKKCLGKMQDVAGQGRTVLFVSHNMQALISLTRSAVYLKDGKIMSSGNTTDIIRLYLNQRVTNTTSYISPPSSIQPRITCAKINTSEGDGIHRHAKKLQIVFSIATPKAIKNAWLSYQIFDSLDRPILHSWISSSTLRFMHKPGTYDLTCNIPKCRLYLGNYHMTVHLSEGPLGKKFETIENICPFEITMLGHDREFPWRPNSCAYIEDYSWSTTEAEN